jgi:hypothetical protein
MTKKELKACEKVMREGIRAAEQAEEEFYEAFFEKDTLIRQAKELKGHDHLGYAEGINQVLATIGFKHSDMKKLQVLI